MEEADLAGLKSFGELTEAEHKRLQEALQTQATRVLILSVVPRNVTQITICIIAVLVTWRILFG